MERLKGIGGSALAVLALVAVWQVACVALAVPSYLLPTPLQTIAALAGNAGELAESAVATFTMALLALALAAAVALPAAFFTALSPWAARALRPLAVGLQVTPVVAIAPLVTIWAGLEHAGRAIVALAAIVAFFPIYSGAVAGLQAAPADLQRLFDLYGASRMQRLMRLQLPSSAPYVLQGFRVAVGLAIIGAVVAEFVAGTGEAQGLAWRVLEAEHQLKTPEMFAALGVLAALAAGLHALSGVAERRLLRAWRGRD